MSRNVIQVGAAIAFSLIAIGHTFAQEQTVQFNRDIRPILSDKCYKCHGPDENTREGELRLDVEEQALAELDGHFAIVPGDLAKSQLYVRITSADEDERMPPADSGKELSEREIALLRDWIKQGAKWQKHWSLTPPERPAVPATGLATVNAVDRFIAARLVAEKLQPAAPADKRTLIRRIYFDLIGLPPSPQDVDAFLADNSDDAYEKLVDRLLESEHFGERLAMYWLDLVRYADTIGYHSDVPREVSLYRDYVIRAFNQNMPFDQFTVENLAGDLLPERTNWQWIASGYNRLLQTTEEGGAQPKEYMAKYAADRVRNVSEVWLGATMGCSECHDHKFDPYTMKDFYSMAAFFADLKERAVGRREATPIPTDEYQQREKELASQLAAIQKQLDADTPEIDAAREKWIAEMRDKLAATTRDDFVWIDDQNVPAGQKQGEWTYVSKDQGPVFSGEQSRKQTSGELVQHFVIMAKETLSLSEGSVFFAYVYLDPKNPPQEVMLQFNDGSWEHRAWWGEDKIPFGKIGSNGPNHKKMGPLPKTGEWVRLEVPIADVGLTAASKINGMAFTQFGGTAYWDKAGVNRDGIGLPSNLVDILRIEPDKLNDQQTTEIAKYFRTIAPQLADARKQLADVKKTQEKLKASLPNMLVSISQTPRDMRILPRGNWLDDSGEVVQPNTPDCLTPMDMKEERRATRLDLARWITRPDHPMTARVFVNRLWKMYFGYGIARTLDDLGAQGQLPTHPELLDWLAVDFVDNGWNVKRTVKLLVMSNTYRQSSRANADLRLLDPYNRLFARQSRWRLDAELVRDNALSISGLLVPKVGGGSVKPYQPAGYWAHLNFPQRTWQKDSGEQIYRRGLYTHWQRTFLHPSLVAFDAPTREECTAERSRSNTPQQALVLLNDPTYVEAARVFAEKIIRQGGESASERIDWSFREALSRTANEKERTLLVALFEKHLAEYKTDPAAAAALLSVGDRAASKETDAVELAAWTSVARVILNLHETITRN